MMQTTSESTVQEKEPENYGFVSKGRIEAYAEGRFLSPLGRGVPLEATKAWEKVLRDVVRLDDHAAEHGEVSPEAAKGLRTLANLIRINPGQENLAGIVCDMGAHILLRGLDTHTDPSGALVYAMVEAGKGKRSFALAEAVVQAGYFQE